MANQTTDNFAEPMLEQTHQHHVTLSSLGDAKANMLLTISSVTATLCLALLDNMLYRPALAILMLFSLVTIFLACFVVIPRVDLTKRLDPDLQLGNPNFNPLFFGDFHTIRFDKYLTLMELVFNNPTLCHEIELREIHGLGQYLAKKKFNTLRAAYLTFMAGFISAAVVLCISLMVYYF